MLVSKQTNCDPFLLFCLPPLATHVHIWKPIAREVYKDVKESEDFFSSSENLKPPLFLIFLVCWFVQLKNSYEYKSIPMHLPIAHFSITFYQTNCITQGVELLQKVCLGCHDV